LRDGQEKLSVGTSSGFSIREYRRKPSAYAEHRRSFGAPKPGVSDTAKLCRTQGETIRSQNEAEARKNRSPFTASSVGSLPESTLGLARIERHKKQAAQRSVTQPVGNSMDQ
jgi:hypothetical protein